MKKQEIKAVLTVSPVLYITNKNENSKSKQAENRNTRLMWCILYMVIYSHDLSDQTNCTQIPW